MKHSFKLIFARVRWFFKGIRTAWWTARILSDKQGLDKARKTYHDQLIEEERVNPNGAKTLKLKGKVEILDEMLQLPYG